MTARKARQSRSRLFANRLLLAVLVLLALAALYGVAGLNRPVVLAGVQPTGVGGGQLPVISAMLACPAPGSGGVTGGGIAQASAPASAGQGQLTVKALDPAAGHGALKAVSFSSQPGQLTVRSVPEAPAIPAKLSTVPRMAGGLVPTSLAKGGLIITATGASAQGLDVEQLGPDGRPSARCQQPGSDFWFVTPGAAGLHIKLYLLNADSQAASAGVAVQTDSGPLLGTPDSGIVVPPHGLVLQTLDKLVGSANAIAIHVTTSVGKIVAAVRVSSGTGKPGIWLPVAGQPAKSQVLTGLPTTTGSRVLYIAVPAGGAAAVKVTAVTPRGSYQPTGGSGISLVGPLTSAIAIPSLGGLPGSIKVTSNVPVTSVLEVSGGPAGAPGAFIAGADAITEQGVVAASPAGSAGSTELELSAPGSAATVRIVVAAPGSALTGQRGQVVHIPARSATQLRLALPKGSGKASVMAIVVTPLPGSGPVYAARVSLAGDTVQTILPVISSPAKLVLPLVRESLLSVLGT